MGNESSETLLSISSMSNVNPVQESVEMGMISVNELAQDELDEHGNAYPNEKKYKKKQFKKNIKKAPYVQFNSFEELLESKIRANVFTINVKHFEKIVKLFAQKYNLTIEELSTLFRSPPHGYFTQECQQKYDDEKQNYFMLYVRLDYIGDEIIGMVIRQEIIDKVNADVVDLNEPHEVKCFRVNEVIRAQHNEQQRRITEYVNNHINNVMDMFVQQQSISIIQDTEYTKRLKEEETNFQIEKSHRFQNLIQSRRLFNAEKKRRINESKKNILLELTIRNERQQLAALLF